MGRILTVVLGLGVVLGAAYYYVNGYEGRTTADDAAAVEDTRALKNVREAAGRMEDDAQKRADELLERAR